MALRIALWLDRRVIRDVTVRQIALGIALVAVVLATRLRWEQLVSAQMPFTESDTKVFQQIAERPLGLVLAFDAKPLVVPLVYRAAGSAPLVITRFQSELEFASWAILTVVLAASVRRRWARAAAIGVGVAFVLAPVRVGFTGSLMPESINDSAMALATACALAVLRLRGRPRIAAAIATGLAGAAWMLSRDTSAFTAVAAAAVAMVVWRGWQSRTAWALSALIALACGLVLWTTTLGHEPLPFEQGWYARFTPRGAHPLVHNVMWRVYPDERDELPAGLAPYTAYRSDVIDRFARGGPELRPLQDWVLDHGTGVYLRWLVRHPIDRVRELIGACWLVFAPRMDGYMAVGWERGANTLRAVTANHWVLLVLLLAGPWLLWRPRADPLRGVALCMVASGIVGAVASFYGDATEMRRHCYGAGQQVLLGLAVGAVVAIDRVRRRARASEDAHAAARPDRRGDLDVDVKPESAAAQPAPPPPTGLASRT